MLKLKLIKFCCLLTTILVCFFGKTYVEKVPAESVPFVPVDTRYKTLPLANGMLSSDIELQLGLGETSDHMEPVTRWYPTNGPRHIARLSINNIKIGDSILAELVEELRVILLQDQGGEFATVSMLMEILNVHSIIWQVVVHNNIHLSVMDLNVAKKKVQSIGDVPLQHRRLMMTQQQVRHREKRE